MVKPVWADFVSGALTATLPAMNAGSTQTMTSDGLVRLPSVVDGVSQAKLSLDPFAAQGGPELVYVRSHAKGSNTAVIQRVVGQPLRQHLAAEQWVHAPTAEDFNEFQAQLDNQFHTSLFTASGQIIGATAPDTPKVIDNGLDYRVLTVNTAIATNLQYRAVPYVCTSISRPIAANGAYEGIMIYENDTDHVLVNNNPLANGGDGNWIYVDDPPGTISAFAGASLPSGWLWCNGQSLDSTQVFYMALFAAIGQQFGGTANMFNLPDLRDRFIYGWNQGVAGEQTVPNTLGYKEGTDNLTLTANHIPAHTHKVASHLHSMIHNHTQDPHNHAEMLGRMFLTDGYGVAGAPMQGGGAPVAATKSTTATNNDFLGNTGGSGQLTTDDGTGGGAPVDFTPRRIRLGFMIRR